MLTFEEFARINAARADRWHGADGDPWTLADWLVATCGELGEAANVAKKLRRIAGGTPGNKPEDTEGALRDAFAEELADTLAYLFLTARAAGVDLETAAVEKFNAVSIKHGFPERLPDPNSRWAAGEMERLMSLGGPDALHWRRETTPAHWISVRHGFRLVCSLHRSPPVYWCVCSLDPTAVPAFAAGNADNLAAAMQAAEAAAKELDAERS